MSNTVIFLLKQCYYGENTDTFTSFCFEWFNAPPPNTILVLYIPSMLTCLYSCSFKMPCRVQMSCLPIFLGIQLYKLNQEESFSYSSPHLIYYTFGQFTCCYCALFVNNNLIHLICSNVNGRTTGYQDPIT